MATFTKFRGFVEAVAEKVHNLGSDTLKIVLTNTLPDATLDKAGAILSAISQISTANGYTGGAGGGATCTTVSSAQTSGTYKLVISAPSPTWTASGGNLGNSAFQWVVLYNDTATNDELIGFWDYTTPLTITSGNTFTVSFDGTNGVLTIA